MTEENGHETQAVEVVPEKKPLARIDIGPKGLMIKTHDELYRFAGMVLKSDLCPKDCKSAEDAFVRMQYGLEIGLSPMQSLQRIANVNLLVPAAGDQRHAAVDRIAISRTRVVPLLGRGKVRPVLELVVAPLAHEGRA